MFENMEQLEREIKEFEQNILASRDLIASIRDTADAVASQNETVKIQIGKVVEQLKKVPADIDNHNAVHIQNLQESNKKYLEDTEHDLEIVLKNLNSTVTAIKAYEKTLENTNDESVKKVQRMIDGSLTAAADDFVKTVNQYQEGLSQGVKSFEKTSEDYVEQMMETVEELKKYEKILTSRYEKLLVEVEETNSKVTATVRSVEEKIEEIKNTTESKQNLTTILLIICIVVSAISILL